MKSLSLCTPVWGRAILTEILFRERVRTFEQARELGVECQCIVIGEGSDLELARSFGFPTIEAPNVLGSKYNDGHEWAVREGFDFSFQVNSDQTFDPRLLAAIAESPTNSFVQTRWLTSVHRDGEKAIATWNPLWAMRAYPLELLRRAPRPCDETLDRMCDSGVYEGVLRANPGAPTHEVVLHPMETIQFESPTQLTSWGRHVKVGLMTGTAETRVPWEGIELQHGEAFVREMKNFYGVR